MVCFDDATARRRTKSHDKFKPIRTVFETWLQHLFARKLCSSFMQDGWWTVNCIQRLLPLFSNFNFKTREIWNKNFGLLCKFLLTFFKAYSLILWAREHLQQDFDAHDLRAISAILGHGYTYVWYTQEDLQTWTGNLSMWDCLAEHCAVSLSHLLAPITKISSSGFPFSFYSYGNY